jgi:uncharacterized membrane protein HdeD (DUF308 family)
MDGWQAVTAILIGGIVACFLAYTGHETIAAAIGGSIVTGVFSLLTQLKHKTSNGNGTASDGQR